ncbi:FIST signal transduction protein [Vibrio aestuarianus]|uniref:FIST signal transduction protein n=1 Tax=Vibrio aestuarianus TaxID=28171 RepID=UPI00237C92E9|nr:FIST N-terminal domain-containing protein [Vibrio aestuarianus]MDE1339241.1 FIST C-terminal domain-containing protein [Vibrio aestuarianus]
MRLITKTTQKTDPIQAIEELLLSVEKDNLSSIVCYYTEDYSANLLSSEFAKHLPQTPIIGCSSCRGVMTEYGFIEGPVIGVILIYDSSFSAFGTGFADLANPKDIKTTVNQVLDHALVNANRLGEVPSLIVLHSTPGHEERLIQSIDNKFGTQIPIIGGSAADNQIEGNWSIFTEAGATKDGFAVQLFFPSKPLNTGFSAGYSPTEFSGIVTKASGRYILEIDNEPAKRLYKEWVSDHSSVNICEQYIFEHVTRFPLGRIAGSLYQQPYYKLSHPVRMTRSGALELFTDITEGDEVTLMTGSRDQLITRASRVFKQVNTRNYHDTAILGAIAIFCAGSMLTLGSDITKVHEQIKAQIGDYPFICPFTFGEQGRFIGGENAHGNLMISSVIFYDLE